MKGAEAYPDNRDLLAALVRLFVSLSQRREFMGQYSEFASLFASFNRDLDQGDPEVLEGDLTRLYCYLHGKDSAYAPEERRAFDQYGGYWCHAGGLSPLARAGPHISPKTRLADYGAGNGLQGLLFQYLYPHIQTCQIELSRAMIEKGKRLQQWMGIAEDRVTWLHKNVIDVPPTGFDFIYLYRPLRPEGPGKDFYENFARALDTISHGVTIFSIADCLKDFLSSRFTIFHDDGHLTCFSNEA
jgi:hypothetical protein